jgi:hypothetical protein
MRFFRAPKWLLNQDRIEKKIAIIIYFDYYSSLGMPISIALLRGPCGSPRKQRPDSSFRGCDKACQEAGKDPGRPEERAGLRKTSEEIELSL